MVIKVKNLLGELSHPLVGCKVSVLIKLFIQNKFEIKYIPRFLLIFSISLLFTPLRLLESVLYFRKLKNTKINENPIFILGHWRSGTTHLQNLLSLDDTFGTLSTFQAISPTTSLLNLKFQKKLVSWLLPGKRPMDNMLMSLDAAHEEEFALGNISTLAVTHGMWFPKRLRKYFEETVLFSGNNEKHIETWKKEYLRILKKASILSGGRPLVLKNPPNTSRIKLLIEMFPNAKFIHIYRDPFVVFPSTLRLYTKLMESRRFNTIEENEKENIIIDYYSKIMEKYLEDKKLIAKKNLIEIKFENFEKKPLDILQNIYTTFDLTNYSSMKPVFENYINSQSEYVKNQYSYSEGLRKKIASSWKKTIKLWNYNES